MYEMRFCTGVKPENKLDKNGKFHLGEYEILKGGVIHIQYYLEEKPDPSLILKFLAPENYLSYIKKNEVAIKIVGGGMLSDYAIFQKINPGGKL